MFSYQPKLYRDSHFLKNRKVLRFAKELTHLYLIFIILISLKIKFNIFLIFETIISYIDFFFKYIFLICFYILQKKN